MKIKQIPMLKTAKSRWQLAVVFMVAVGCFLWIQNKVLAQWTPPPGNPPEGTAHLFINPMIENLDLHGFGLFDATAGNFILDPGGQTGLRIEGTEYGIYGNATADDSVGVRGAGPANGTGWGGYFGKTYVSELCIGADENNCFTDITADTFWQRDNGIDIYYNLGKVGIGTATPNQLLHVYKTSGDNAEIDIQSTAVAGSHWGIYHDRATANLIFWQGANNVTLTPSGSLTARGDIGGTRVCIAGDCRAVWPSDSSADGYIGNNTPNPHLAGANLGLNGHFLSNDGQDEGISITNDGHLVLSGNLTAVTGSLVSASVFASLGNINTFNAGTINATGNISTAANMIVTGTVGVGTATPAHQLHLYRTSGANSELDIQSVAGANNHWGIYQDRTSADLMFWQTNNRVVFTNEGRVGIGNTAPGYALDVTGDANATRLCIAGDCRAIWPSGGGGDGYIGNATPNPHVAGAPINMGAHNLYTGTGRIGVGTAAPGYPLDVSGVIRTNNAVRIERAGTSDAIQFLGGTNQHTMRFDGQDLRFWTPNGGEVMRLRQDTGYVGIGIATPGNYRLNVAGDMTVSGAGNDLYVNAIYGRTGAVEDIWLGDSNDTIRVNNNLAFSGEIMPEGSTCAIGQILKKSAAGLWVCASDDAGAGGDGYIGQATNPSGNAWHLAGANIGLNGHWLSNDGANEGIAISNTGQVGIGTAAIGSYLANIAGDLTVSGAGNDLFVNAIYGRAGGAETIWLGEGDDTARVSGNLAFDGEIQPDGATCTNGQILQKIGAGDWDCVAPTSVGYWSANGSHIFNNNTGNVGIKTNNPGYPLHVVDNDNTAIINIDNIGPDLYTGIRLANDGAEKWFFGVSDTNHSLIFRSGATNNVMRLTAEGELRLWGAGSSFYLSGPAGEAGGNIWLSDNATVDGADISDFSPYFIDSGGTVGQVWTSDGAGQGVWQAASAGAVSILGSLAGNGTPGSPLAVDVNNCAAGQSIRQINADGTVVCEVDDSGASGDGYIGNATPNPHVAGAPINMNGNNLFLSNAWLSGDGQPEGIFIAANGAVGINDNTPSYNLDISGSLRATGNIFADSNLAFAGEIQPDGATCAIGQTLQKTAANDWDCVTPAAGGFWAANGSEIYYNAGNVGIGVNDPGYKLHVTDDDSTAIFNIDNTGTDLWTGTRLARDGSERWFVGMYPSADNLIIRQNGTTDLFNLSAGTLVIMPNIIGGGSANFSGSLTTSGNLTAVGASFSSQVNITGETMMLNGVRFGGFGATHPSIKEVGNSLVIDIGS